MTDINFEFRQIVDPIVGADHHSYCMQCGACVGDCPAAKYSDRFNPRQIMLMVITGQEEELLKEGSMIWECTNCYNCFERCPQDVRPVEVIIALKNLATQRKHDPDKIEKMVEAVSMTGRTTMSSSAVNRIRGELGLEEVEELPVEELKRIL
jgi:heterodisulfide reductase subunit C